MVRRWNQVAAFVLAGGASTRMGRDKALLELGGELMLVRAAHLAEPHVATVSVVAPAERYRGMGIPPIDRAALARWAESPQPSAQPQPTGILSSAAICPI